MYRLRVGGLMTPTEHYREAEAILAEAAKDYLPEQKRLLLLEAQVHATLATADPDPGELVLLKHGKRPAVD
jgi:hypothetical protein